MSKYKTKFQDSWLGNESYRLWLEKGSDQWTARCKWCFKSFNVSAIGESALKSHASSAKHKKSVDAKLGSSRISSLFHPAGPSTTAKSSESTVTVPEATSLRSEMPSSTKSVSNFVTREDSLSAEILWTFHTVGHHQSFHANQGVNRIFERMFPDSSLAKSFGLSERKSAYLTAFGLAPYIRSLIEKSLKDTSYVLLFDESMNREFQTKQMDFYVRLWDCSTVKTRYLTSTFLGHATAEDMKASFFGVTDTLDLGNLLQLSMDGPNVNWSFFEKINNHIKNEFDMGLINTGSCGLHKVHGACKVAMDAGDWHLDSILKAAHKLFTDTPARREDFTNTTGSQVFPLNFCKHRWLENAKVAQRLIDLFPSMKLYINCTIEGKLPAPKTMSYATIKDAVTDVFLPAKLAFFVSFSKQVEPFLTYYQGDAPLLPFMYRDINALAFKLLGRFVKESVIAEIKTSMDFLSFKVDQATNHVSVRKILVGFVAESMLKKLKESKKASELQCLNFRDGCKEVLVAFMRKFLDKSPLQYRLVGQMACLDPEIIISSKSEAMKKFEKVLQELINRRKLSMDKCDDILGEFSLFIDEGMSSGALGQFQRESDRLDTFYCEQLSHRKFKNLLDVIKQLLLLSHGQATVERGFSVNREIEDCHLKEHTLIGRRLVVDYISSMGGLDNIFVNPQMLMHAGSAHSRYRMYLDEEKERKEKDKRGLKRKNLDEEITSLSAKKKCLLQDIQGLTKSADEYAMKAENERKISWIVQSNSMKKRAREKEDEVKLVESKLDDKLLELKNAF